MWTLKCQEHTTYQWDEKTIVVSSEGIGKDALKLKMLENEEL